MVEIKYVKWGLAARFGNVIELHEDLKNYPKLHDAIIEHEMLHDESSGYTVNDFLNDINGVGTEKISKWELFKFQLVRPKTWIHCLPFYYQRDKGFVIDWFRTIMYSLLAIFIIFDIEMFIKLFYFLKRGGI